MFLDEFDHIIKISIHALREEGDALPFRFSASQAEFQSTPSARRATEAARAVELVKVFQSTPSARRATQWKKDNLPTRQEFQSTPSARRATSFFQ